MADNTQRHTSPHIPILMMDSGISMAQHKQGVNGRTIRLMSDKQRTIEIHIKIPIRDINAILPSTVPTSPSPTRQPIRQRAANNIEVRHIDVKPNRSMKMRTTISKRHSIATLKLINPHISFYLSFLRFSASIHKSNNSSTLPAK